MKAHNVVLDLSADGKSLVNVATSRPVRIACRIPRQRDGRLDVDTTVIRDLEDSGFRFSGALAVAALNLGAISRREVVPLPPFLAARVSAEQHTQQLLEDSDAALAKGEDTLHRVDATMRLAQNPQPDPVASREGEQERRRHEWEARWRQQLQERWDQNT